MRGTDNYLQFVYFQYVKELLELYFEYINENAPLSKSIRQLFKGYFPADSFRIL